MKEFLKCFFLEVLVYGLLVIAYFLLILHFLEPWLYRLFETERAAYAALAMALMVGQGFVLEAVTRGLSGCIRFRRKNP